MCSLSIEIENCQGEVSTAPQQIPPTVGIEIARNSIRSIDCRVPPHGGLTRKSSGRCPYDNNMFSLSRD